MTNLPHDHAARMARAYLALDGLSLGDAFGERFFGQLSWVLPAIAARELPSSPWYWTDDTAMGISVVEVLERFARIDRDALSIAFARRHREDPARGYGSGAHQILTAVRSGADWREASAAAFGGQGSMGNGAAMRVAPVGAYFADDLDAVIEHAGASAEPTHMHRDGQAGAIAIAVAAALSWRAANGELAIDGQALLEEVARRTPEGLTKNGLHAALDLGLGCDVAIAAARLGSGRAVIASDTVPFCVWNAARNLCDFEAALWNTVAGLGDRDTTCAIVGGIVACHVGRSRLPALWLRAREALPDPIDSPLHRRQ